MVDFGTPDIISGLIYAGPGNTSLMAAAVAWTQVAEQLEAQALDTRAVLSGLDAIWQGSSAQSMVVSVQRFSTWTQTTAIAARQTAQASMAAATAYEEVFAAVVPPPVIASNRAQLLMLVVTNLLGQNTAAIAATEAQYEAFWAQDIAAMNVYQAGSAASTAQLPTFQAAPQVSTPPATLTSAAAAPAATVGDTLSALFTEIESLLGINAVTGDPLFGLINSYLLAVIGGGFPISLVQLFSSFFGPFLGSSMIAGNIAAQNAIIAAKPTVPTVVYPPQEAVKESPKVSASSGSAGRIGPMRVPPSWTQLQQPKVGEPLSIPNTKDNKVPIGLPVIPAVPVTGSKGGQKKGTKFEDLDYGEPVPPILSRHPSGG